MSGSATVLSVAGATVPASGIFTADGLNVVNNLIQQIVAAAPSNIITYDPATGVPTVPAGQAGQYVLVVPNSLTQPLNIALPTGYGAVVLGRGTNVTISGGDPTTQIVSGGILNYTGGAGRVDGSAGSGTIFDTYAGATVQAGGGPYSVTASGSGSVVQVDNGAPDFVDVSGGTGESVLLGTGFGGQSYANLFPYASTSYGATVKTGLGDVVTVNSTGNLIVDNNPGFGSTTINALYGSSTVFAGTGDLYDGRSGNAVTEFLATGNTQTVFGGAGNDTVFGQAGTILYGQGSGSYSYFIGGTGQATVDGNGAGAVFGSQTGGSLQFNLGNSNDVFVAQAGGSDTITGGSAIATVFGNSNETLRLVGTRSAFVVPLGTNNVLDASGALGSSNFFDLASQGNATLIGSATGVGDTFQFLTVAGAQAHTVDVRNFRFGDGVFLSGYGAADVATFDNTINAGGSVVSLSDGTTIRFDGLHPTIAVGNAAG